MPIPICSKLLKWLPAAVALMLFSAALPAGIHPHISLPQTGLMPEDIAVIEKRRFQFVHRCQKRCLHHPAQFVCAGAHGGIFPHSAQRADDLPGQIHIRALRYHRQRHTV